MGILRLGGLGLLKTERMNTCNDQRDQRDQPCVHWSEEVWAEIDRRSPTRETQQR